MIDFKKGLVLLIRVSKKKVFTTNFIDEFSTRIISDLPGFISSGGQLPPSCPQSSTPMKVVTVKSET